MLEQLVGLQAQNTASPYVALWSRLDGFRVEELSRLLRARRAVRLALFRSTVHLVTARDADVAADAPARRRRARRAGTRGELEDEGARLLALFAPAASRADVRFAR